MRCDPKCRAAEQSAIGHQEECRRCASRDIAKGKRATLDFQNCMTQLGEPRQRARMKERESRDQTDGHSNPVAPVWWWIVPHQWPHLSSSTSSSATGNETECKGRNFNFQLEKAGDRSKARPCEAKPTRRNWIIGAALGLERHLLQSSRVND